MLSKRDLKVLVKEFIFLFFKYADGAKSIFYLQNALHGIFYSFFKN